MATFRIEDAVPVPMRDGVTLVTDIWLPDGPGPWPVLLQRTPYRREDVHGAQYISALEFQSALRRGIAVVVQDTRGRYGSEGDFVPFAFEAQDGTDTIAWLRAQDFCDGRVAMFGASYVGATQVLAASAHPEGLVAISPQLTTARHGAGWTWRGGAVELGFLLLWIIEALALPDLDRRRAAMPAEDAKRLDALIAELQRDPLAAFERLPLIERDLVALGPYVADWFDPARAAASDTDPEHLEALRSSSAAMLVTGGWNDLFMEGAIELFETARSRRPDAAATPDRLIVGPWSHGNPKDWQGDSWLGYTASTAGLSEVQLGFFQAIFDGTEPPGPMVRYFRTGSNSWHGAPDWPLPGTERQDWHLSGDTLSPGPSADWSRDWTADPADPVPTVGGATFLPGLLVGRNSGPLDQAEVEARQDVLVFTGPPLTEDIEVTGPVDLHLYAGTTAPTTDWTARLCEVDAQGRSRGLVDGILRQTQANAAPDAEISIRLGHISHLFRAGTRLRLQIASSNFPRFDRNPQSGADPARCTAADFRPARQTVAGGPARPSRLVLPVIPKAFPERPAL